MSFICRSKETAKLVLVRIRIYLIRTIATTDSDSIGCYTHCDPSTEKTAAGALSETDAGVSFIANLPHTGKLIRLRFNCPHTGKQYDCVILSKTDSIGFLPQKFKNNGKINLLKPLLCYESSFFRAY